MLKKAVCNLFGLTSPKVGINGFGKIGKMVLRMALKSDDLEASFNWFVIRKLY